MTRLIDALLFLAVGAAGSATAGPLSITDAWIRATPPGARTAAAYLTMSNTGPADRLLEAVTSAAAAVEVHTHVAESGLQRMVRVPELAIPAGATVRLEPGGLHLMLIDLAAPLDPGTSVTLALHFAGGGDVELQVPVVDARSTQPAAHSQHREPGR